MNKITNRKKPSVVTIIMTTLAIISAGFNYYQWRVNQQEKELKNIPDPIVYYWTLPGDDWTICEVFNNSMNVNIKKISSFLENIEPTSSAGIFVAKNCQFQKFLQARNRIDTLPRSFFYNNVRNWKFLFVVNDEDYAFQIKSLKYTSKKIDTFTSPISLEKGCGLLIPLGFTEKTEGDSIKNYVRVSNIEICRYIGNKLKNYNIKTRDENVLASPSLVLTGNNYKAIFTAPPND